MSNKNKLNEIETVTIVCPRCEAPQHAKVTARDGDPFPTCIHWCSECNYCIMESEWETLAQREEGLNE